MSETDDVVAIQRLQSAYADAVSRRAWAEFDRLFLPDCPVRVDTVTSPPVDTEGPAAIADFIAGAVERFSFFELVILNAVVRLGAPGSEHARGRLFVTEHRLAAKTGAWSTTFGVYHDEYRRTDGGAGSPRWWFAARRYQSLARTETGEVFPFPHAEAFGLGEE